MTDTATGPHDARARLEQWLKHPQTTGGQSSADGRWFAFVSTRDGIPAAFRVPDVGGAATKIEVGSERVHSFQPARQGGRAMLAVDHGGDEQWQLAAVEPAAGDGPGVVRWLTSDPKVIHSPGAWRDGRRYVFTSNARDPKFFDVHELDAAGSSGPRRFHQEDALLDVVAADGSRALVRRTNTNLDGDLLLLRDDGASELTSHSGELTIFSADLAPNSVLAAANPEREFAAVVRYGGGSAEVLYDFPGDVELIRVAPSGRAAAVAVNDQGWSRLYTVGLDDNSRRELSLPAAGVVSGIDWVGDGASLLLDVSVPESGADVLELELGSGRTRAIAPSPQPLPARLRPPTLREFTASDGLKIPFWDFRPVTPTPRGTIVWVHGGPESQSRPQFLAVHSFFVEQGWRLIVPNVRGSTGYGRTYVHLDDVRRRMDSVRDLRDLVRFLADQGEVSSGQLGVAGGSYGGFMVLSALTTYPELWGAGAEWVGIANFVTFLEHTRSWRRKVREDEYGSLERDREFLESISPIHHIDRIRAPLCVVHGANDPRVPVEEAEQIVAALRARGVPVEYLRYDNEGHGLVRRPNQVEAYGRVAEFFAQHLERAPVAAPVGAEKAPLPPP